MTPLLSVQNLNVSFGQGESTVTAVRNLSFDLGRGEILALVGESGSGKTNAVLALLDLVRVPGRWSADHILFDGTDLSRLPPKAMRQIRGRRIAMIFQDPMTALNPLITVGRQMVSLAMQHLGLDRSSAWQRGLETLSKVGITAPEDRMNSYPHQLSGGLRQRVMIAMALVCEPELLIADEPTTALDMTIQAQILELVKQIQREYGMSILWITHDLGVVAALADRMIVMFAGRQIEAGSTNDVFNHPAHPYSAALMGAMPRVDRPPVDELKALPSGRVAETGCAFRTRCNIAQAECNSATPPLAPVGPGHLASCWFSGQVQLPEQTNA